MSSVNMITHNHRAVGAFISALAKAENRALPESVEGFMEAFASFLNYDYKSWLTRTNPPPAWDDLTPVGDGNPDDAIVEAVFAPNSGNSKLGTWSVAPYFAIENVKKDAKISLPMDSASHIVMRLPDKQLLQESEAMANNLSDLGDLDKFAKPQYYYDYFYGTADFSAVDYLCANIGDYVTKTCR